MDDAISSGGPETSRSIPVPAPSQSGLIPVNGVNLHYELFGSGSPLVLVPGEVADSRIWDDQIAAFAERYQVVRFDSQGSGRSESGTEPFTYVGDMASMLSTLHVDRAYLAGIVDGATLAVEYALEHPDQVEALVLVNTTIRGYVPETISPEDQARVAAFFSHLTSTMLEEQLASATPEERLQQFIEVGMSIPELSPTDRPEARARLRSMATEYGQRLLAAAKVPGWEKLRAHVWLEPPAFQRLSEIYVPTMIVVGEPLTVGAQQAVEALAHAIAGAKVALIPAGESTMINVEQPEAFNRMVLDFLGAINRSPRQ
jgi:pimeloyl-ACP methyl ester carboxylesterase